MIELGRDWRKWLLFAAGFLCLSLALGLVMSFKGKFGLDTSQEVKHIGGADTAGALPADRQEAPDASGWAVYVTGAVMRPGVYEVAPGSRVNDALKAAGGFSVHADPEAINLAAHIADGIHIKVPEKTGPNGESEPSGPNKTDYSGKSIPEKPAISPQITYGTPPRQPSAIDINSATHGELCTLPGIGPKLAQSIIEYREINGPFASVEDICQVRGIGVGRLEGIRELIIAADR